MAPKRVRQRQPRSAPYNPELYENWTMERLREEIRLRNLRVPATARRMAIVRILRNQEQGVNRDSLQEPIRIDEAGVDHNSLHVGNSASRVARSQNATAPNVSDVNNLDNNRDRQSALMEIVSKLSTNMQSLQQNVITLTAKVNAMTNNRPEQTGNASSNTNISQNTWNNDNGTVAPSNYGNDVYTIETATRQFQLPNQNTRYIPAAAGSETQARNMEDRGVVRTQYGFVAESLPVVETISPQLRQNIIAGRDVNLAALLIPYYIGSGIDNDNLNASQNVSKPDPRLNRSLTLAEFIQAFSVFKNVMCSAHPHRRNELDLYERDIVDMATRYSGRGFYEYHRQFSLQAAAHLRYNNRMVDWSVRNNSLFCNIFANLKPNSCDHCNSTLHLSAFCPTILQRPNSSGQTRPLRIDNLKDSYGRNRLFHMGKEICNNFNGIRGCTAPRCNNLHVCTTCKKDHSISMCPLAKNDEGPQKSGANHLRKK